jgi:hypothetical protein
MFKVKKTIDYCLNSGFPIINKGNGVSIFLLPLEGGG